MNQSEFKAIRSAHRLELRTSFRNCYDTFKQVVLNRSQLIKDCEKPLKSNHCVAVWHFKKTRLGFAYDWNTNTFSKPSN
jgi:hypothetical protein